MIADCVGPKQQKPPKMMKTWMCFILMGLRGFVAAPLASDEDWVTQTWFKDYLLEKDLIEEAKDGLNGPEDEMSKGKKIQKYVF